MEVNFRLVVILVASVVILILLVDAWVRERRKQMAILKPEIEILPEKFEPVFASTETHEDTQDIVAEDYKEDLIVINVIAKSGNSFSSYDLLQAISATGLQYGPMNIFHYYEDTPTGKVTLFNLASATEPGDFDLNQIGHLNCAGLTLFMNLRRVPDANEAFEIMLDTAEQLAEDLDGVLYAGRHEPWSNDILIQYQRRVTNYQTLM